MTASCPVDEVGRSRATTSDRGAIAFEPMSGALGAHVHGIDLVEDLTDDVLAHIESALHEHLVLQFHAQAMSPEQHLSVARRFGRLTRSPFIRHMADHPEIIEVRKEAAEHAISTFGNAWHSDFSFLEEPPLGSLLYAREVPTHGGDTLFANMVLAYETLSAGMRRMLDDLRAMHAGTPYGTRAALEGVGLSRSIGIERNRPEADREIAHPVVRTHPVTGRRALFVNPIYTTRFEGMTEAESRPLLDQLYAHMVRPELTCRVRWRAGDLTVWDNRCTLHYAVNDYDGQRRLMHRITIAGTRPS